MILYTIEMNEQNNIQQFVQPFANVTSISCTKHEPEIMFSIGQIFQIRSIEQNETTEIWTIYLQVLAESETEQLHNLTNYYQSKIVGTETFYNGIQTIPRFEPLTITTFVTIGNYYSSILVKDYAKAEFYYQKFLQEELQSALNLPRTRYLNHSAHGFIYSQLANIRFEQQKYLKAFEYNSQANKAYLEIQHNLEQQTLLVPVFNNYAKMVWKYSQQYDQAMLYYSYALQINRNDVETFINIGLAQITSKEYVQALNSFLTSLSILDTFNRTDYLLTGLIYRGMGRVYQEMKEIWQALPYYIKAQEIYEYSVPSNHELLTQINDDINGIFKVEDPVHDDL
jgi:tetratricopeptide (TPR) repeat protein